MRELLTRRPVGAALVVWFLLLAITTSVVSLEPDGPARPWMAWLTMATIAYAAFAMWFFSRRDELAANLQILKLALPRHPSWSP
jgi:RsiW-degrading membrane proteinase PrsW (M82 family)